MPYDEEFLGRRVPQPDPPAGSVALDYTHFSVGFNPTRRLCWWSAWNVDGARLHPGEGALSRDGLDFYPDERVPATQQALDDVYRKNRFDRGHVARRADLLWGPLAEAKAANRDSFCFTNITPQMDDFNQSGRSGSLEPPEPGSPAESWGLLENAVLDLDGLQDRRLSVLGGPVLRDDDPVRYGLQIPLSFWKVVVYRVDGAVRYRAFVLTQRIEEAGVRTLDYLEEFRTYQVGLDDLGSRTGLSFAGVAGAGDPAVTGAAGSTAPEQVLHAEAVDW